MVAAAAGDTLFVRTRYLELGSKEAPDGAPRRARSEAACSHLKQRLSLPRNDKFLLHSQRPVPSGCLGLFFHELFKQFKM